MIRRPPRSTLSSSSAASDVYKRQVMDSSGAAVAATGADAKVVHAPSQATIPLPTSRGVAKSPAIGLSGQHPATQLLVADGQVRHLGAEPVGGVAGVGLSRFSTSGRTPGGRGLVRPSGDAPGFRTGPPPPAPTPRCAGSGRPPAAPPDDRGPGR